MGAEVRGQSEETGLGARIGLVLFMSGVMVSHRRVQAREGFFFCFLC